MISILRIMDIKENGTGSNYKTLNNNPTSHFNDPRVSVEIYPTEQNTTSATITCKQLDYDSGLQQFNTEQEANLFAMNMSSKLIAILDNRLEEVIIHRVLELIR